MRWAARVRALGFDAVLIERGDRDAERLTEAAADAGLRVEMFSEKQMVRRQVEVSSRSLVAGGLNSIRTTLQTLQRPTPAPLDYPDALAGFLRRRVWPSTLATARNIVERSGTPVFVKPSTDQKRFTGMVLSNADEWMLASVPGRTPVWCSDVVTFATEHRVFVCDGTVVGSRPYWGDPAMAPNPDTVSDMVREFGPKAPAGYALDVGITAAGATALIEANDGFALDSYGLEPERYLAVIAGRWRELVGA